VLLLTVDSLRCDRLRLFNPEGGVATPNLEQLAARGTVFSNAWATAPWTAPSIVSVFSGLYPPSHGVAVRDDTTPPSLPTLPRLLAARGYKLGNFAFFSGISYFRNLGLPAPQPGLVHQRMAEGFRQWLPSDAPFFAWLHLIEPHMPYGASGYKTTSVQVPGSSGLERTQLRADAPVGSVVFEPGDRDRLLQLYDRDLVTMDETLGAILATISRHGLAASTLVVVVADHGEELLDHGWVGHASTSVKAKLVPEILHVPLVVAGPGVPAGAVCDDLVQQVDLLPSICRLLGIQPPGRLDGTAIHFGRQRVHARRKLAFFDSSVGGNLTPIERAHERLNGVTDGTSLLVQHIDGATITEVSWAQLDPASGAPGARAHTLLSRALRHWRRDQAGQRLRLLGSTNTPRPDSKEIDTYAETIAVMTPSNGATLAHAASGGQLVIQWQGQIEASWVEYQVGRGPLKLSGMFEVTATRLVFGPFPEGFWNDLVQHNPFRFRIIDPERQERSPWIEFSLLQAP